MKSVLKKHYDYFKVTSEHFFKLVEFEFSVSIFHLNFE